MVSRTKVVCFLVITLCVANTEIIVKRCQTQRDECKEQRPLWNRFRFMLKMLEIVCLCFALCHNSRRVQNLGTGIFEPEIISLGIFEPRIKSLGIFEP